MKLDNICNALAESVFDMTDEEIEEELNENDDTEEIREVLLNAVRKYKTKRGGNPAAKTDL